MRDIVLRKRAFNQDFVCTTFFVPEGNYRFTLEGCNEYAEGIIRNAKGDVVAILKPGESVDIARRGKYLICIQGRNAVGTIWTEWIVPPATDSKEYCCDELRATDEVLRTQIEEVKDKINNIQEVVVEAGVNVTVTREGNTYIVNAVDTIPDVDKAYVDAKIAAIEDKDTITTVKAGANVTVTQSGNDYTVSALDTVTTVKAGANVTVTQSGNDYTVNTDVNKAYVDDKIANIQDNNTITTVSAGKNIGVTKTGDDYEVKTLDNVEFDKVELDSQNSNGVSLKNTIQPISYNLTFDSEEDGGLNKQNESSTITAMNIQIKSKQELGTTSIKDRDVTISSDKIQFAVRDGQSPQGGSVLGLGNKTFDSANITSGRAATEDQLVALKNSIDVEHSSVSAGKNIGVTKNGNDYEVKTLDDVEFNKVELDSQNSNGVSLKNTIRPISYNLTFDSEEDGGQNKQSGSSTITAMNIQIKSKQELGTTSINDRDVIISSDKIQFSVRDGRSPQGGSILGLGNKTFDPANITSGQAATEDQLVALKNSIDVEHSSVSAGKNIGVTKNGNDYEVKTLDDVEFNKVELDSQNLNGASLKNTIQPISYNLTFDSEEDGGLNKQSESSTITAMNIQIKSKQEIGTTSIKDRDVTISSDKIQFTVRDGRSPQGGSILGLDNKTFDPANITSGRAATEDQLVALKNILDASDDDTVTTLSAGNGISVQKTGNNYEVTNTYPTLVAGSNVTLTPNSTNNTITISSSGGTVSNTTVSAGKNIGVTKTGDNYEVKTLDNVKFNNVELGPDTVGDAQFYWRSNSMGTIFSRESPTQEQVISYNPYGFTGTQLNTDSQGNTETRNFSLSPLGYNISYVDSNDVEVSKLNVGYDRISLKNNNNTITLYDGNITGLTNKTFNPANISSGRAATEDQLVALKNIVDANDNDTFHFTETSQGGIYRSKNFVDTQVYQNSMSLAQYDGTRNYGKSSIYLSEIDPITRYYKFAEDYVPGTKQIVVSLEDIGFPSNDITVENILKYPIRYGGSFYSPTNAAIDNENKIITITIDRSRNNNDAWKTGNRVFIGTANYGNGSFVTGAQNYGAKSVVAGNDPTVNRGNFSLVVGNVLYNSANDVIIGGYLNRNSGQNSIVSGRANNNLAERSFVVGNENSNASAAASDSVVFGVQNENTKTNSFVFGAQNKNEGASSFVGGGANTNTGINSFVYGTQCNNTGMMNVLFGLGHDSSQGGGYLFACGYHSDITGNTLFAVGNGQENNRKNAFEVSKDGSIYLRSPNGTKYKLAVDDSGTLTVTPAT